MGKSKFKEITMNLQITMVTGFWWNVSGRVASLESQQTSMSGTQKLLLLLN